MNSTDNVYNIYFTFYSTRHRVYMNGHQNNPQTPRILQRPPPPVLKFLDLSWRTYRRYMYIHLRVQVANLNLSNINMYKYVNSTVKSYPPSHSNESFLQLHLLINFSIKKIKVRSKFLMYFVLVH